MMWAHVVGLCNEEGAYVCVVPRVRKTEIMKLSAIRNPGDIV